MTEDLTNAVSAEQAIELINYGLEQVTIDELTTEDIDRIILETLGENPAIPNLPGDDSLFYNGAGDWTPLEVDTMSSKEINQFVQEQTKNFVTEEYVSAATNNFVTEERTKEIIGQTIVFATEEDVRAALEQIVWSNQ